MNSKLHNTETVIALCKDGDIVKAVQISRYGESFAADWQKDLDLGWQGARGLIDADDGNIHVVAAFDSSCVGFYNISVPDIEKSKLSSIVKVQAESLLPMAAEDMCYTWRKNNREQNKLKITIAAGNRKKIEHFADLAAKASPDSIVLDYESITEYASFCLRGKCENFIVITFAEYAARLCLIEKGELIDAYTVEADFDNLSLMGHEIFQCIENFGPQYKNLPTYVIAEEHKANEIIGYLTSMKINATKLADVNIKGLEKIDDLARRIIGSAMLIFDERKRPLNLFDGRLAGKKESQIKKTAAPLKLAVIAFAAVIILAAIIYPAMDISTSNNIENLMNEQIDGQSFKGFMVNTQIRREIGTKRIDMPELFEKIKKALPQGMMVDEFTFKTGQPIKIRGFCPNYDMLYKFQQGLSDVKGIKNVNILSPRMDQKNNRLEYSMVFDYKDFTRKAK
jgi:hypothetical protein